MASKRHIRRKACTGKVRHETEVDARRAISSVTRRDMIRQSMNVYRCRWCGGFHVGHSNYGTTRNG